MTNPDETGKLTFTQVAKTSDAPNLNPNGLGLSYIQTRNDRYMGWTDWHKTHVSAMNLAQAERQIRVVEMALYPEQFMPISDSNPRPSANDQVELVESLNILRRRIDELMPTVPGRSGGVVHQNARDVWPNWLPSHTMQIHLHLSELMDAWRIGPHRSAPGNVGMNQKAEREGITAIDFDSGKDVYEFVKHYELRDFVITNTTYKSTNEKDSHYLVLHNRFQAHAANDFIELLRDAILQLATISNDRRHALMIDQGRVGYMSVDHFSSLERKQIDRIQYARRVLASAIPRNAIEEGT